MVESGENFQTREFRQVGYECSATSRILWGLSVADPFEQCIIMYRDLYPRDMLGGDELFVYGQDSLQVLDSG